MATQSSDLIAFTGGGSGGHLYPLFSVAQAIRARAPQKRFLYLTTDRAIDRRLIEPELGANDIMHAQPVQPIPKRLRDAFGFVRAWRKSVKMCREILTREKPEAVIGSGGFGSAPGICVAEILEIPRALLNPDAVPGKANRFIASKVETIFVQWEESQPRFEVWHDIRAVGCPVRQSVISGDRQSGIRRFDLDPFRKTLLVTGASQGASSINLAVAAGASRLAKLGNWQILHLTGDKDVDVVREAYGKAGLPSCVVDYTEHMGEAMAAADLIVSRGGASTLGEITAAGLPACIIPYPHHRDRHQYTNSAVLTKAEAAVMVEDPVVGGCRNDELIETLEELMADEARLAKMARAAAGLGTPDAAERIADWVLGSSDDSKTSDGEKGGGEMCRESVPRDDDDSAGQSNAVAAA